MAGLPGGTEESRGAPSCLPQVLPLGSHRGGFLQRRHALPKCTVCLQVRPGFINYSTCCIMAAYCASPTGTDDQLLMDSCLLAMALAFLFSHSSGCYCVCLWLEPFQLLCADADCCAGYALMRRTKTLYEFSMLENKILPLVICNYISQM